VKHALPLVFIIIALVACVNEPSLKKIQCKVLTSEFIYDKASFLSCHASTIVETNEGLLVAWFGGTREQNPDVCIYTSANRNGEWSTPELVADGIMNDSLRYPCWNPVLFKRNYSDVILFYKVGPSPSEWWGMYKISEDNGKSWSTGKQIPDNMLGPIKNKPHILPDGKILYPTSFETLEKWNIYVETSDKDLIHWSKLEIDNKGFNAIQPTILFYDNGRIQMLCRSKEKRIVETWSSDQGKTWLPVKATALPNNNSGLDAVTLENGLQLLVCNPIDQGRNKLAVLASVNGKDWSDLIVLEDQPKGEFSYPAIIKGKDGTIHITYTYKREKIKHVQLELIKK
jgi:predicted neuraminidase